MAITKRGDSTHLHIQPGSELDYEQDGLIRGQIIYEGDVAHLARVPQIGDKHPDEPAAVVYHRKITKLTLRRIRATLSYIGITRDPTDFVIEVIGAVNREPIDTHEDFVTKIGGTKAAPKNSAKFDAETGQFICFPATAGNHLGGVDAYLKPTISLRRSYWTKRVPDARAMGQIIGKPADIITPTDVKNMLIGPITYRIVGKLYQVSEEQLGSGKNGWNTLIYG